MWIIDYKRGNYSSDIGRGSQSSLNSQSQETPCAPNDTECLKRAALQLQPPPSKQNAKQHNKPCRSPLCSIQHLSRSRIPEEKSIVEATTSSDQSQQKTAIEPAPRELNRAPSTPRKQTVAHTTQEKHDGKTVQKEENCAHAKSKKQTTAPRPPQKIDSKAGLKETNLASRNNIIAPETHQRHESVTVYKEEGCVPEKHKKLTCTLIPTPKPNSKAGLKETHIYPATTRKLIIEPETYQRHESISITVSSEENCVPEKARKQTSSLLSPPKPDSKAGSKETNGAHAATRKLIVARETHQEHDSKAVSREENGVSATPRKQTCTPVSPQKLDSRVVQKEVNSTTATPRKQERPPPETPDSKTTKVLSREANCVPATPRKQERPPSDKNDRQTTKTKTCRGKSPFCKCKEPREQRQPEIYLSCESSQPDEASTSQDIPCPAICPSWPCKVPPEPTLPPEPPPQPLISEEPPPPEDPCKDVAHCIQPCNNPRPPPTWPRTTYLKFPDFSESETLSPCPSCHCSQRACSPCPPPVPTPRRRSKTPTPKRTPTPTPSPSPTPSASPPPTPSPPPSPPPRQSLQRSSQTVSDSRSVGTGLQIKSSTKSTNTVNSFRAASTNTEVVHLSETSTNTRVNVSSNESTNTENNPVSERTTNTEINVSERTTNTEINIENKDSQTEPDPEPKPEPETEPEPDQEPEPPKSPAPCPSYNYSPCPRPCPPPCPSPCFMPCQSIPKMRRALTVMDSPCFAPCPSIPQIRRELTCSGPPSYSPCLSRSKLLGNSQYLDRSCSRYSSRQSQHWKTPTYEDTMRPLRHFLSPGRRSSHSRQSSQCSCHHEGGTYTSPERSLYFYI